MKGFKSFASRKSERKRRKDREVPQITLLTENIGGADGEEAPASSELPSGTTSVVQVEVASRTAVLQACILTSAGLLLFGVLIRQVILYQSLQYSCLFLYWIVSRGCRKKIFNGDQRYKFVDFIQ